MKIVDEIYDRVLTAVIKTCEPEEGWMKCNKQECVEVRALLVHWLFRMGLNRNQIAEKTGLAKSAVVKHLNDYEDKKKYSRILVTHHTLIDRELSENSL